MYFSNSQTSQFWKVPQDNEHTYYIKYYMQPNMLFSCLDAGGHKNFMWDFDIDLSLEPLPPFLKATERGKWK